MVSLQGTRSAVASGLLKQRNCCSRKDECTHVIRRKKTSLLWWPLFSRIEIKFIQSGNFSKIWESPGQFRRVGRYVFTIFTKCISKDDTHYWLHDTHRLPCCAWVYMIQITFEMKNLAIQTSKHTCIKWSFRARKEFKFCWNTQCTLIWHLKSWYDTSQ